MIVLEKFDVKLKNKVETRNNFKKRGATEKP
jgi:hypothetical protein